MSKLHTLHCGCQIARPLRKWRAIKIACRYQDMPSRHICHRCGLSMPGVICHSLGRAHIGCMLRGVVLDSHINRTTLWLVRGIHTQYDLSFQTRYDITDAHRDVRVRSLHYRRMPLEYRASPPHAFVRRRHASLSHADWAIVCILHNLLMSMPSSESTLSSLLALSLVINTRSRHTCFARGDRAEVRSGFCPIV